MKKSFKYFWLPFCFIFVFSLTGLNAQSIKILGGNTLNGALNGTMMGAASMAINNTDDFAYARIGLGAGTLYGMGVGIYDIAQVSKGDPYFISGTFNDGNNSTIIVLLDTFYGAAAGSIIATSVTLITDGDITEGLQYGAGFGTWAGFAFGLIDAFVLAEGPGDFEASASPNSGAPGLITVNGSSKPYSVGLLNPGWHSFTTVTDNNITLKNSLALDIVNFKLTL